MSLAQLQRAHTDYTEFADYFANLGTKPNELMEWWARREAARCRDAHAHRIATTALAGGKPVAETDKGNTP